MMEATPVIDLPDIAEPARVLRKAVDEMNGPVVVVLDGGAFDDLPDALASEAISCRSLFLEGVPLDFRRAGPWMAEALSASMRSHVEWLDTHHNCAVYWSCPAGPDALYRHLRTLNEVMIPREGVGVNSRAGRKSSAMSGFSSATGIPMFSARCCRSSQGRSSPVFSGRQMASFSMGRIMGVFGGRVRLTTCRMRPSVRSGWNRIRWRG
ncbi:DUF4123 domain-containing protein [Rhizobium sp. K102]|uniref:DUF4123 domain-containing protein n=1 Tax=Rhizobium sp. K102 TaxID=2918527 RepID=UPI0031F30B7D